MYEFFIQNGGRRTSVCTAEIDPVGDVADADAPLQVRRCLVKLSPPCVKESEILEAGVFRVTTCCYVADIGT